MKPTKSIFVSDVTRMGALSSIVRRLIGLFRSAIFGFGSGRYLLFTPPTLSTQIVFDRQKKKILKMEIRDFIDFCTLREIYLSNSYDIGKLRRSQELYDLYDSILNSRKTPLIIDCGGNIGLATRYFSENYDKAKILCIEPDPENVAQAKTNNSSLNIVFVECAIGSEEGRGKIIDPGLGRNAYRITTEPTGTTKIVSINSLLKEYDESVYTPFIVKIDIEGFESELFSKNVEWIEKFPLLIIELHDWLFPRTSNSNNFVRSIAPLNRDFVFRGDNVFSISNTII